MSQNNQVAKIKYVKFCAARRDYKSVSHEKLNQWTVKNFKTNGMFESLKDLEYVRLYFDFDFHEGDEIIAKIKEIVELLDKFKNIFGEYVFCGYCCDEELYNQLDQDFRKHIELKTTNLGKPLSFHVVFYESIISQNELCEIMNKAGKYNNKIKDFADLNVYKNADKEQLLRHPYANKYGEPYKRNDQELKGVNFDNLEEPFDSEFLVATPRGNEKIISKDQWSSLFTEVKKESEDVGTRILKELESKKVEVKTENVKEIDYDEIINKINEYKSENEDLGLIIDDEKCLDLILKCFQPTFESLEKLCCIINSSPFSKEILLNYMSTWYKSGPHDNPKSCEYYINKYYKNERSNKWFYSTIKHLPEAVKEAFLNKFGFNTIDESVKFDVNTTFTLTDIRNNIDAGKYYNYKTFESDDRKLIKKAEKLPKKFECEITYIKDKVFDKLVINKFPVINFGKLFNDLKRCFAIINETPISYIFNDVNGDSGKCQRNKTTKTKIASQKLEFISISYYNDDLVEKSLSLWDIIKARNNSRYVSYTSATFFSKDPSVFSYFYEPFERIENYKADINLNKDWREMTLLERWFYHVNSVICDNDQSLIDYIHCWIAKPLQTPNLKNKTALILKGKQGSGKTFFTDMISRLHGPFSAENVGDISHICGKFNKLLENKTFVVANEVKNTDNNIYYDGEKLKTLITEYQQGLEGKCENAELKKIYANFVFVSNNDAPVSITDDDRRYVVITPNNNHGKDDYDYWSAEFYDSKDNEEFLRNLYNYYINLDLSKYNPRNIPMTAAKAQLIADARPRHEEFIIEYITRFENGWEKDECFDMYKFWCRKQNITNVGCEKTFRKNMNDYIVLNDQKDSKSGGVVKVLPRKRIDGKMKNIYKLTDEKYEELKQFSNEIENDD